MAVTSRELHPNIVRRVVVKTAPGPQGGDRFGILRQAWKPIMLIALLYATIVFATGQAQVWHDDLRYGRPRTTQVEGWVGHNEQLGQPSHFIALNLNRRVTVIELPGGDASKAKVLQGPYLFGAEEDLTPIQLTLVDVNNDQRNDVVISVKREQIMYVNTGDTFRLINAEERQQVGVGH